MNVTLHFDGLCEPRNPGGTGCWGFLIEAPGLDAIAQCGTLGASPDMTNNRAEFVALGKGVRALVDGLVPLKAGDHVTIRGDSKLVIEQLSGRWECRSPHLRKLLLRCRELLGSLPCEWHAEWIPREENADADALTQRAYTEATGTAVVERPKTRVVTETSEKFGREKPGPCRWCDQPGMFLCDHPTDDGKRTCDAPMCANHAYRAGAVHIDYRDKQGRRRARNESIDYCPDCRGRLEREAGEADAAADPEDE